MRNEYQSTAQSQVGPASTAADRGAFAPEAPVPRSRTEASGQGQANRPPFQALAHIAAVVLMALSTILVISAPAQAASYRDLKSVRYGGCLYAYGDPLEDIYLKKCSTTPAKYGNWTVTNAGYYNNHPLWIIKRQGGSCLGVLGSASSNYLYSSCSPTGSKNVWEVFTTSSGRYVLKSFGAFQIWGQHKCLTFGGPYGGGRPQLGACNLSSTIDQTYK